MALTIQVTIAFHVTAAVTRVDLSTVPPTAVFGMNNQHYDGANQRSGKFPLLYQRPLKYSKLRDGGAIPMVDLPTVRTTAVFEFKQEDKLLASNFPDNEVLEVMNSLAS